MTIESSNPYRTRFTARKAKRNTGSPYRRWQKNDKHPVTEVGEQVVDTPNEVEVPCTLLSRASGSFDSETCDQSRNVATVSPMNSDDEDEQKRSPTNGDIVFQSLAPAASDDLPPNDADDGDVVEDASDCEILTDDEDEPAENKREETDNLVQDQAELKETSSFGYQNDVPDAPHPLLAIKSPIVERTNEPRKEEGSLFVSGEEVKPRRRRILSADLRVQLTPLRTMRAVLSSTSRTPRLPQPLVAPDSDSDQDDPAVQEADRSSSEESSYDDEFLQSMEFREAFFDDDADQVVDFSSLPHLPNTFLNVPPDSYDYLDPDLVKTIADQDITVFAWEHHLLVKGLLQLLAERDHIGVEGDVLDPSNIIKMGSLKKKFAQLWFVKYVEIRKGNLSYYEDTKRDGQGSRKTIHLRKRTCACHAVDKDGTSAGFVFELIVEGGPRRLWMAKSEEERQGWIRAINQAMIGETDDATHVALDLSLYQTALDFYQSVQVALQGVKSSREYMVAASILLYRQKSSSALRVPLQWVRDQVEEEEEGTLEINSPEERVKSSITDFWKGLCNTSVYINGHFIDCNSAYSAERVVGSLSRCILEFDKCEVPQDRPDPETGTLENVPSLKSLPSKGHMTEVEAVSYARTILMTILRSQTRRDAFASINYLCRNDEVVLVEEESSEPLHIDVSFAGDDFLAYEPKTNEVTGWFHTRPKKNRSWKERFFVISEGVLSFYENAHPRPHGLRGQLVLGGATLEVLDDNILQIQTRETDRQIMFQNRADFHKWKTVFQTAIDSQGASEADSQNWRHKRRASLVSAGVKPLKDATEAGVKLLQGATSGGIKADKPTAGERIKAITGSMTSAKKKATKPSTGGRMQVMQDFGMKSIKGASELIARARGGGNRQMAQFDLFMSSTRNIKAVIEKREPTVQVVVELSSTHRVIPANTDNSAGALLVARAKLFQAFLLSGGSKGRIVMGDELVEMEFCEGEGSEDVHPENLEPPTLL